MEIETPSPTKPLIVVKEKRKFNWLVLALLVVIVAMGGASLLKLW